MKQIIINMGDIQYDVLTQYAEANNLTPEQYATNIIVGWINSHLDGYYIERVREDTYDNLKTKFGAFDLKKKVNK
jgi:hypothetical protein